LNEEEQAEQFLADFKRAQEHLSRFFKSAEAERDKRVALVNKLVEDHNAGKISWEHFDEMMEAAIEEERHLLTTNEELMSKLSEFEKEIERLAAKLRDEKNDQEQSHE
jgi:hypothetical protein